MAAGGGGGQQTGFFYFDTNIDAVVADVEGGMARLQKSLAGGTAIDQGAFSSNVQAVRQGISKIVDELNMGEVEIRELMSKLGSGQISEPQFLQGFTTSAKSRLAEVRGVFTREMANLDKVIFDRLPVAEMGRATANSWLDSIIGTVGQQMPTVAQKINKMSFGNDIKQAGQLDVMGTRPTVDPKTGLTSEVPIVGRLQQLKLLQRAEEMVAKTAGTDPFGQLAETKLAERIAGMTKLTKIVRDQAEAEGRLEWHDETDTGSFRRDPSITAEARSLEQAAASGQAAANTRVRLNAQAAREAEREAEALAKAAKLADEVLAAQRQVAYGDLTRTAGRLVGPNGEILKSTTAGLAEDDHAVRIEDVKRALAARQAAEANAQMLMQAPAGSVQSSGAYRRYQGDLYKMSPDGSRAEEVTNLAKIQELNDKIDQSMGNQVTQAERLMAADEARAAKEAERAAAEAKRVAAGQAGLIGGFSDRFSNNDKMSATTALGSSIASAAKFSLAYGALFGLQSALRDVLSEFKDYQDSYTDLQVATRDTDAVTGDFVNRLGELARVSGSNVGAALDTAARAVRAFGDPLGNTTEELQAIGESANSAATKLALIADKSLQDATGDTISVGTAFNLAPDQLSQVVDAIANAKRTLGGDPAQIAQGLSLIAGAAQEAGYGLNEAASVISLVQARTDQSGQAIATRLTRIFQIVQGSTGKTLSRELGVDPNQSVKSQIEDYAKIYSNPGTSEAVKDKISSALGGTANLRELLPLLKEGSRLQAAYKEAVDNAGQGSAEFTRKSENLVGTLKKIAGTLSAVEVNLANSGLFDIVGAAIYTLEPALHAVDRLLQAYNELPRSLRTVLGLLIDIALASKLIGAVQAHRIAATAANVAVDAEEGVVEGAAAGAAMKGGGLKAGAAALGGTLLSTPAIIAAAAVAGLVIFDKLKTGSDQIEGFQRTAAGTTAAFDRFDGTATSLKAAAFDLHSAAGDIKGSPANFLAKGAQSQLSRQLEDRSQQLDAIARRVTAEETKRANAQNIGVFGNGAIETVDQLTSGLQALTASGATAVTQLRLVRKALSEDSKPDTTARFQMQRDTFKLVDSLAGNLKGAIADAPPVQAGYIPGGRAGGAMAYKQPEDLYNGIMGKTDLNKLQKDIVQKALDMGLKDNKPITTAQVAELTHFAVSKLDLSDAPEAANQIRRAIRTQMLADLKGYHPLPLTIPGFGSIVENGPVMGRSGKAAARSLLNGTGPLTRQQLMSLYNPSQDGTWTGIAAQDDAAIQSISPFDDGTKKQAELKRQITFWQTQIARVRAGGGNAPGVVINHLQALQDQYIQGRIADFERLREVAQNKHGLSKVERRNIGANFLQKELAAAGDDTNQAIKLIEGADNAVLDIVEAHLRAAARVARAARLADIAAFQAEHPGGDNIDISSPAISLLNQPSDAENTYHRFKRNRNDAAAVPDKGSEVSTGSELNKKNGQTGKDNAAAKYEAQQNAIAAQSASQIAQDRAALNIARYHLAHAKEGSTKWWAAQAELSNAQRAYSNDQRQFGVSAAAVDAARLGGGIAQARSAIVAARAGLAQYAKGTVEYNEQLAGLFDAQRQMRDAVVQYQINKFQLHGDITDPVENARDTLKGALAQLHSDAGSGADVIAADKVAVRQDHQSLLAARFSQRLSDVQTADQLGKISHEAYIRYLEHEHDRLTSVKHKTRQQTDELNQIDLALKDAIDSADGQFNLGDINTNGLVYQVRRFQAEQRAMVGASTGDSRGPYQNTGRPVVNQQVQIHIDGADVAKVKSILTSVLGGDVSNRRTLRNRKV